MPTPVCILHPPTRPMMLVGTGFHGSDPRLLPLVRQSIGDVSKKKCFSNASRHTLVVLEMH